MRFYLFLFILAGLLWGCDKEEAVPPSTPPPPVNNLTYKYLALGDSYTVGQGVPIGQRFPAQLVDSLKAADLLGNAFLVAQTGWTTDELQTALAANPADTDYDLVSLLIGVNNQYRAYPIEDYVVEFEELLQQAIAYADGRAERVIVLSIPDYAYTPFGQTRPNPAQISADIDAYNAINAQIAAEFGVSYVDVTPISRQGLAEPGLVAGDGLHPSGEMYRRWVSLMLPTVKDKL